MIFTHECKRLEFADMISILEFGHEIARRAPEQLVQDFRCETLEEAYTKLLREANQAVSERVWPRKNDAIELESEVSIFSSLHH